MLDYRGWVGKKKRCGYGCCEEVVESEDGHVMQMFVIGVVGIVFGV